MEDVGLNCLPAENVDGDDVENDARKDDCELQESKEDEERT